MKIQTAEVLPGSESPAVEGSTGALRCTLVLADGTRRAAVLKRAPLAEVAAEAFSALLLRNWGLTVPEPFLVDETGALAFASADAGYPSLRQRLGVEAMPAGPQRDQAEMVGARIAAALSSAPLAAAADEAIENRDRNFGNILWDGAEAAWIDHAYSLGQSPDRVGVGNKLCVMAVMAGSHEAFSTSAVAHALSLDRDAPHHAQYALPTVLHAVPLASFVAARLGLVASRLLARFPAPTDLLSGP